MSFHKVPAFDALTGLSKPFDGFGYVLESSQERIDEFRDLACEARRRIENTYEITLQVDAEELVGQLDALLDAMWEQGWNPSTANINLFATDFGLVLTTALSAAHPEILLFRSERDISHVSLWYADCGVEAFPFHKILKRLLEREGESIASFVRGVRRLIAV